jgi:hypothetical protein
MTATECFSGDCGLCLTCTNNTEKSLKNIKSDIKEDLQRANDLYKIIGKKSAEEAREKYNKNLIQWCKKYGYKEPQHYNNCPKIITDERENKYKLIKKKHSYICASPYCKMIYVSSNSWEQQTRYPIMPIYYRDNVQLCGPCMTNDQGRY